MSDTTRPLFLQKQGKITFLPSAVLQRKCVCGGRPGPSECEECRKKRLWPQSENRTVAKKHGTQNDSAVLPIVHEVLRSPGQPLDAATRAFMEPRFGHDFSKVTVFPTKLQSADGRLSVGSRQQHFEREADSMAERVMRTSETAPRTQVPQSRHGFSQVRVHTDTKAVQSARAVNALAYTVGANIVFGQGQFAPSTTAGRHLLAHELTHVVQQTNAPGLAQLQRQEAPSDDSRRLVVEELGQEPEEAEEDEDMEDGDTDVPGLDQTPDPDLPEEPHGPEPLTMEGEISTQFVKPENSLGQIPTGKIKHVDVDQVAQRMVITFKDGQKISHVVSTGKGECGTVGDPCKTQNEHHCTPNGTFLTASRGNANTANSKGDAMAWFVGLSIPGRKGIGIHNSQTADGIPRSHGCVRVGKNGEEKKFAKMINEHVQIGKTNVTISGKAKTKPYPCPLKKKKKP